MIKKNSKKLYFLILSLSLILFLLFLNLNKSSAKLYSFDEKNCTDKLKDSIVDIDESIVDMDNVIKSNNTNKEQISHINDKSKESNLLYSAYIKTEGNISDDLIGYLDTRLQLIPKKLLSAYFDKGGLILLTDKDISSEYYPDYNFGNIIGLHDATKNIIFMSNSKYAIDNALIHEFGHVLDSLFGWDSMNEYFLKVFEEEKDSFEVESLDGHYKSNEREFFAEIFQESILNPDTCKLSAPKAFSFVNSKIKDLK